MKPSLLTALCYSFAVASTVALVHTQPAYAGHFANVHPRRAQVLHRDGNLRRSTNANYGHLGGHYGQLRSEEKGIHQQERADKNGDGGHITRSEQHQLNQEENGVRSQIRSDRTN